MAFNMTGMDLEKIIARVLIFSRLLPRFSFVIEDDFWNKIRCKAKYCNYDFCMTRLSISSLLIWRCLYGWRGPTNLYLCSLLMAKHSSDESGEITEIFNSTCITYLHEWMVNTHSISDR